MNRFLVRAYHRHGPHYLARAVWAQQQLLYPILVGAVAFLSLYVDMSLGEFVRLALVACALQLAYSILTLRLTRRLTRPVADWLRGERTDEAALAAWRAAASLPRDLLLRGLFSGVPGLAMWSFFLAWCFYFAWELDLGVSTALLVYAVVVVLVAYGGALRFFGAERIARPVLEDLAATLPDGTSAGVHGLPLRERLLVALPAINVITAVVAYGLARGGRAHLGELLIVFVVSAGVAATISLLLTVLLSRSITEPIARLCDAVRRVGAGDLDVRLAVVTTDETGELTRAFNEMTHGLGERERLREAFGTYVDPQLTERILREGTDLAGEELEVSVLFMDVRGFTTYSERASAREVVGRLNDLYECVVPVIARHGGHANKFIGDGLLAVFGAPVRLADHADCAVAAAVEIAEAVREHFGGELRVGVGVNSGPVMSGTIGGGGRLDFTVIGDTVNTAARVESATRQTGDDVLVTEATRMLLTREVGGFDDREAIALKGKTEAIRLSAPRVLTGAKRPARPRGGLSASQRPSA